MIKKHQLPEHVKRAALGLVTFLSQAISEPAHTP